MLKKNEFALFGTNMCFRPQEVTIKIATDNKRLKLVQHNVQDFDCQLVRWFFIL